MTQTEQTHHTDDLRGVEQGDQVTLTTAGGTEIQATCTCRETAHSDNRVPAIYEQTTWTFVDSEGTEYQAAIIDGLSPHPDGGDAYPSYFPLHRTAPAESGRVVPDEAVEGYVEELLIE